jgi:hypothetical protein
MCIISIPIEKKLNGKSPYEAFYFYYGKDLADKLGCHHYIYAGKMVKKII